MMNKGSCMETSVITTRTPSISGGNRMFFRPTPAYKYMQLPTIFFDGYQREPEAHIKYRTFRAHV